MLRVLFVCAMGLVCAVRASTAPYGNNHMQLVGAGHQAYMPARRMPGAPPILSPEEKALVIRQVLANYPGALREDHFVQQLHDVLHSHCATFGHGTLVATSLCCDEINRGLESKLSELFGGTSFSMGGLAGFPFGGCTSFGAFAHHIPSPAGSALVVFGPHVGVDANGAVGKVDRRGLANSGACCGSAVAALKNAQTVLKSDAKFAAPEPKDFLDAQQGWVAHALLDEGRGERVVNAANPQAQLPRALFEAQKNAMHKIVSAAAPGNVPAGTTIALVGGIQINTPDGVSDFFLPLVFELRDADGGLIKDLLAR